MPPFLEGLPLGLWPLAERILREVFEALATSGEVPLELRDVFSEGTVSEMARAAARLRAARELGIDLSIGPAGPGPPGAGEDDKP